MSYFSRLTDIVTCNLGDLLTRADDPKVAIQQLIAEMEEGLFGARRSVKTAADNEHRLYLEIQGHREQSESWSNKARESLRGQRDVEARQALLRKREVDDLIAGLQQQHGAAVATRQRAAMDSGTLAEAVPAPNTPQTLHVHDDRLSEVDAELEALKREMGV
ncbi:MAG: hypothetical protein B7Z55_17700 [Planctomycetales bacterium 12-60-4]|nr:MAG: hypothetical protein B7Z55_17700 [Planctomycetales bacterium 12-60-4]